MTIGHLTYSQCTEALKRLYYEFCDGRFAKRKDLENAILNLRYFQKEFFNMAGKVKGKQKEQSNYDDKRFVAAVDLGEADEAAICAIMDSPLNMMEELFAMNLDGYKVTCAPTADGKSFCCTASPVSSGHVNSGLILSAFAADPEGAYACLLYKHGHLFGRSDWPREETARKRFK